MLAYLLPGNLLKMEFTTWFSWFSILIFFPYVHTVGSFLVVKRWFQIVQSHFLVKYGRYRGRHWRYDPYPISWTSVPVCVCVCAHKSMILRKIWVENWNENRKRKTKLLTSFFCVNIWKGANLEIFTALYEFICLLFIQICVLCMYAWGVLFFFNLP